MAERISPSQFHDAEGVEDWRVILYAARAHFRTGSYGAGVALVDRISKLADATGHFPDVDLRQRGVSVCLRTVQTDGLSELDVAMAQQISKAARELGLDADLKGVQGVEVAIDALVIPEVLPFWQAVLNYDGVGDWDLVDSSNRQPPFWFQQMDTPRPQRNRIHIDVSVPHDQAETRVAAALAAGGRLVTDANAPSWWVLADVEGNEVCISTWMGRE